MEQRFFLALKLALFFAFFLLPVFVFAANNDPFRSGREAVNPKQSAGVGESTGAMKYSYPLPIPPGRNGVQPSLSLNYSSDDKRQDSIFGYGWSMSIPYIEHTNKLGTNNLYNNLYSQDRSHTFFTSSLSGELLPVLNSTPVGGSFLAFMQGISALALLDAPGDSFSSNTTEDSLATTGEQNTVSSTNTTSVSNETARSFHNFQDTFLPSYVYHPNEEADLNAARAEGARAAQIPIPGFPAPDPSAPLTLLSVIPSPLTPALADFSLHDQATLKGQAIAALGNIPKVLRGKYFIEVESMEPIDGGVEMFIKAWDQNGIPIGFGPDGSVEIERIRSFNPPILVGDRDGDIVTTQTVPATATTTVRTIELARYREDLKEATLRDLEHTLSVKKEIFGPERIIPGKVGRTTDTFRSLAGANDPTDCTVYRNGANESFASIRTNAGTGVDSGNPILCDSTNLTIYFGSSATTNQYEYLYRGVTIFDTSLIDVGDTVSSATFSIKSVGSWSESGSGDPDLALFWGTSASNSSLATGDYANNVPSGSLGSVTAATLNTNGHGSDPSLATFNDIALNSVTNINKGTGARTKIGIGNAWDVNNNLSAGSNAHTWVSGKNSWFGLWSADITGTTNDPKLVLEHAVTVPSAPTNLLVDGLTNPSNIATSSPYFSAIHANASTTALASSYQIQIDTQGTFTSPYWDSGKKSLASSTPAAMRIADVFSTTTFALDGTKYFWRIKFWDQAGGEGAWSTSADYFIMQVAGDYMAKVDDGSFMRYTLDTDGVWIAYDKRGWKYTFGATTNARINDPATTSMIYRWYLEEIADTNGNKVIYHYSKDGGQVYPTSIDYTDHGSDSLFQITFATSSRGISAGFATSSIYGYPILTRYNISDITAKVNNQVVRRYTPTYTTGDNQSRSLLASIQETGYRDSDGSGALTYPATTFTYQTSTTSWTQVTGANSYEIGFDVSDTSNNDYGWRLFDINGDALPDWVKSDGSSQTVLLNTGSNWSTSTAWTVPVAFSKNSIEQGVRMAEVNGDGLIDIIAASSTKVVYINNGTSTWMASTTWAFPASFIDSGNRDQGVQLVDLNGDNMADILHSSYASTTGTTTAAYTNSGHGWTQDTGWSIPEVLVNDLRDSAVRLYDYSGDGLVDIVYSPYLSTSTRAYVNNGRGWTIDASFVPPFPFASTTASIGSADLGVRFADFNGDGCVDVARAFATDPSEVRLASCTSATSSSVSLGTLPEAFRGATSTAYDYGVRMADINGDGQLDITRSFYDVGTGIRTHKVYLKNGNTPDMLKEVVNGRGGRTTVTYKGSPQYQDGGGALLNPNLPFVTQTVRTLTTDSGSYLTTNRVIATTTYDYQRGYFYGTSTDPLLRQFAGFGLVTATSAANAVTKTYFHQGNGGSDTTNGEFADHISKAGKPYRVETYDQSGNLFSRTINKWGRADFGDGRNFVKLGQTLTQTFDGDSTHRDTAASTTYSDTTGNLALLVNYGEVSGNSDGTFTDTGTDLASTTYTYAASSTLLAMSLPARELLVDQSGNTVKDTKWYYDSLAAGLVTFGNQTKEERLISGSLYASTTKTYDAYGNVATSTDPLGNKTGFVYDGYNLFPITVRNAVNQEKLFSYDYSLGKAATTTDENNQTFVTVFDNLDRPIVQKHPDFTTPSTLVTKTTYTYTDSTTTPSSVFRSDYLSTATTTDSYTYVDGFDRTIQTKREAESANGWITKDTIYNSIGKVGQESLPYFSSFAVTPKVLVVAGGGGGGDGSDNFGGGGGAGEVVYSSSVTLTAGAKTITVGAGGAGGTSGNGDDGDNGGDSYYDQGGAAQILADGGGGGAALLNRPGKSGGSGGGGSASSNPTTGGAETADGFGNVGGAVTNNVNGGTGGGGGAGSAGVDGSVGNSTQNGGDGGAGIDDASIGGLLAMTSSGVGGFIGGGGGGGSAVGGTVGAVGSGGGGRGGKTGAAGTVGTANTGGGGGGGGGTDGTGPDNGRDGGSGLVVVVYPTANFTHTGGDSTGTSGSGTWVKFTASGTLTLSTISNATAPSYTAPTTTATLFVTNTYDAAGRVLTTANAVGTTTNTYSDWRLTVTDALGNKKDFNKDAYGNLASVVEYPSAGATTTYAWNLLNKLTKITDASSNVRNFTYDSLGRLTGSEDLHAGADTTFGTTSRQYDLAGNLIQVYTPQGTAVNYTYDALNRIVTEDSTTTPSFTDIVYRYDTCTNGKGRLCEVNANNAATTTYAYNPVGLVGTTSKQIGSTWATSTTSYFRNGAEDTLVYPEGHQIAYVYNDAGDLNRVFGRATTTWWGLVESTNYGPTGQPTVVDYGNNTMTTYTYDATKLYRLTRKLTVSTSTVSGTPEQLLFLGMMLRTKPLRQLALLDDPFASSTIDTVTTQGIDLSIGTETSTATHPDATSTPQTDTPVVQLEGDVAITIGTTTPELLPATASSLDVSSGTDTPMALSSAATSSPQVDAQLTLFVLESASTTTTGTTTPEIVSATSSHPVSDTIGGLANHDQATLKGQAIAAIGSIPKVRRGDYFIEVERMEPIDGGVQFFVKAWDHNGTPIGFGVDGTVEIERIRSYNPPILVGDTEGDIVTSRIVTPASATSSEVIQETRYREDLREATLRDLFHTLLVKKEKFGPERIIAGKVGRTTDTFRSVAGSNDPVDGPIGRQIVDESFSTIRSGNGAYVDDTHNSPQLNLITSGTSNQYAYLYRGLAVFDTSAISSGDSVSTATFSYKSSGSHEESGSGKPDVHLFWGTSASASALATSDYQSNIPGASASLGSVSATTINANAGAPASSATFNDITLSSVVNVNKGTGARTKIGLGTNWDVLNDLTGHTWVANKNSFTYWYTADTTGTADDPKLVVEHAAVAATVSALQDLAYTYDAVGNITAIFDHSYSNAYAHTFYTYDNLYRLTSASTTNATTTNWVQTYAYNDLGNITSKSDVGSYTYAGSGFANPHAPTTINSVNYSYDNAGNLLSYGAAVNTWNYRNRLTDTNINSTTTHYLYDYNDQRVQQDVKIGAGATTSTKYFSKIFETKGATTTLYVFLPNGELLATVEGNGSATSTYIAHTDHQGSTNVMSDKNGALAQLNTYYPFGAKRNNEIPANGIVNERGFIGQYEDAVVQLSYLNARYYDATRGQFASEDPLVQKIGLELKEVEQLLLDPQLQNYYSYARNNPINLSDPTGLAALTTTQKQLMQIQIQLLSIYAQLLQIQIAAQGGAITTLTAFTDPVQGVRTVVNQNVSLIDRALSTIGLGAGFVAPQKTAVSTASRIAAPTLEGLSREAIEFLSKGKPASVYKGIQDGLDVYTGISNDWLRRMGEHGDRFNGGLRNVADFATRNMARAVEQASILANKGQNLINSISPNNPVYDEVVAWGQQVLSSIRQ